MSIRKDPDISIDRIADYRILSCYNEAKELAGGKMIIPRFVSVWLAECCNLRCSGCWWMKKNGQSGHIADVEAYCKMIDELEGMGIGAIEFSGGGESTLHPEFIKIVLHAKQTGMKIGVLTNGTVISASYLSERMCPIETFAYIRISLDAALPKTYFEMKGKDEFEQVTKNVESLTGIKNGTKVGIKFLINTQNFKEIKEMAKLADMLNVNYIQFKAEHSSVNTLDDMQRRYGDTEIKKAKKEVGIPMFGSLSKSPLKIKCFMSPVHTVIDSKGNIYVCCFLNDERGFIGNAIIDGFKTVWFSDKHNEVIKKITPDICDLVSGPGGCRWYVYNEIMEKVVKDDVGNFDFL